MATRPVVSVIIPTRDRGPYLLDAVESVARQSLRDIELIVVDDCSREPVNHLDLARPAHIVRHLRPLGPGSARNTGLAHARGEFVLFLDDDDWITDQRLEDGVAAIADCRMHASPCLASVDGQVTELIGRRFSGDMRQTLHRDVLPSTGQTLFRRADCVQFDPALRLMEDVEWWVRMWDRAVFAWTEAPGLVIRRHDAPREGVRPDTRPLARLEVVTRHRATLQCDRASYAYHLRRAGSAAYLAGRRVSAARLAARSFVAAPSKSSMGLLARSVVPRAGLMRRRDTGAGP